MATSDVPPVQVVLIDDEEALLRMLGAQLTRAGFAVRTFSDPRLGVEAASDPACDVVLVDVNLGGVSGLELMRELKARQQPLEVIVITGAGTIASALDAVRSGAYDYLTKPFLEIAAVVSVVRRAADRKRLVARNRELEALLTASADQDFIGESQEMRDVFGLIAQVAPTSATVLIRGESGTGKELVARSIHRKSPRARNPFVAVNCAAMTETLLESELFGHVKGAFTGAAGAKQGLFEAANKGTLLLDEIGDMPLMTQVKLLRTLQEGEVRPVGANEAKKVDVRLIAATNVDLPKAIKEGKFREDLYYRLNVISVALPPLRERQPDIPLLGLHFLRHYAQQLGKNVTRFSDDALEALVARRWPGNVRELENVVERAVVVARGTEITIDELPAGFGVAAGRGPDDVSDLTHLPYVEAKRVKLAAFDRGYLTALLKRSNDNITAAAAAAGLDRSNFRRLLKEHDLVPNRGAAGPDEKEPEGA